jgi:hypothetical protein
MLGSGRAQQSTPEASAATILKSGVVDGMAYTRDWSAAICRFASRKFSGLQSPARPSAMSTISSTIHCH